MRSPALLHSRQRLMWRSVVAVATVVLTGVVAVPVGAAGSENTISWSDDVTGTTSSSGTIFASNCASQSPNATEEAATLALMNTWTTDSVASGYTYLSPAVVPADGSSGDNAVLTFPNLNGLTATVTRRQVTPSSALDDTDASTGTASANSVFADSQRLQDCAPRPADLSTAPTDMTLARPMNLSGTGTARESLWNATTFPTGNQLDASLFEFSRPVGSFGLWFGDLESRFPLTTTPGGGVLARVKLLASDGTVLATADITPDEATTDDTNCGGPVQTTDLLGCGNQSTRFISFVRPTPDVAKMLVIVGDDDSCTQAASQCDGITEYLSWIGPMVAEQQPDLQVTKTLTTTPTAVGDAVTYTLTVQNNGPATATAGWTLTDIPPPSGITNTTLTGASTDLTCTGLTCTGLNALPAGATVTATVTGTWTAPPGTTAINRAYVLPHPDDTPETIPADTTPPDTTTNTTTTPTNNDTQAPHTITPQPAITLEKSVETTHGSEEFDQTGNYTPNQPTKFVLTITNTGNVDLTNITISDPLATECASTTTTPLPPGETITLNCTHEDGYTNTTTNTATVTADTRAGATTITDQDTADIIIGTPSMTVTKTVETQPGSTTFAHTGQYKPNDPVTFTIAITNTGDYNLTDIKFSDPLAPQCNKELPGPLAPGATHQYTCTHQPGYTTNTTNTIKVTAEPQGLTSEPLNELATADVTITRNGNSSAGVDLPATGATTTQPWALWGGLGALTLGLLLALLRRKESR